MIIRNAEIEDLNEIIDVHMTSFGGFFLTKLGPLFLRELYGCFIYKESGIMRVVTDEEGKVVGFSAGTTTPEKFFFELKKEKGINFFLCSIPGLLKNPALVIKKIWGAVFYNGDTTTSLESSALLSSIAVKPEMSGQSIGKKLIVDFESQIIKKSMCRNIYLITDKYGNNKVISFYKNLNYQVESQFCQSGKRQMLRLVKSLN